MNNDRLKFRVWNIKDEEYVEDQCDECHISFDGTLVAGAYCDDDYAGYWGQYHPHEVIIEQCTGLRDTNGNLIYESDLIIDHGDPQCKTPLIVKWSDRTCGFCVDSEKIGMRNRLTTIDCAESHNYEIIGNIHEQK